MKKFRSIKSKLISYTMILISGIFLIVLSVIIIMNVINVNNQINKSQKNIYNSLITRGKTLVKNNSMAMSGMAEDNAFTAIQTLVSSTVFDDADMSYGIYMDSRKIPWAYTFKTDSDKQKIETQPLEDSMSVWASSLRNPGYKSIFFKGYEIIEFAAPVVSENIILGCIRYGISTDSMRESIKESQRDGKAAMNQMIAMLIVLFFGSLINGYIVIKPLASRITSPIDSLVSSTKLISEGNYDIAVNPSSDDEIGNLAEHFESMRKTIKEYTDHLQEIIDEKMQQVNDILNNIDQGLFTINLDGTINKEYSARVNDILKIDNLENRNLDEILRLDKEQQKTFKIWLNLVKKRHKTQKWKKLTRLAPVQELNLSVSNNPESDIEYVSISYQKILDKHGNLSKIMVLAMDETEKRLKDLQMQDQKQEHENKVKTILSIVNTPPEEISGFIEDTFSRLNEIKSQINDHLNSVKKQRSNFPENAEHIITDSQINILYRNIHTIKGNAGSYGFDILSKYTHLAEDKLEELKKPVTTRRTDILSSLQCLIDKSYMELNYIKKQVMLVLGKDDEISVRVPVNRIIKIQNICHDIKKEQCRQNIDNLIQECIILSWKPLKTLIRKYQKTAFKIARKTHKKMDFIIIDEQKLFAPDEFNDIDDILIHLIRNAVDHGIESPDVRDEHGKGIGHVRFEYKKPQGLKQIVISDDGRGIDIDKLVDSCIKKGLIDASEALLLDDSEKVNLIFKSGSSTSTRKITDISGRGIGMNAVITKINTLGGKITVNTEPGKGTSFMILIPDNKQCSG